MSLDHVNADQDFFEGGTMNLSGTRQRGNPALLDPFCKKQAFKATWADDMSFDTLTSVIYNTSNLPKENTDLPSLSFLFSRDYTVTSYLPDTGTGVFFPGWDATYSGENLDEKNPFLATFGLGAPFPEDMKLCAAANGMWPVASPDAGRTFQGSLEKIVGYKPNTAIPLLDKEIGIHTCSAYVADHGLSSSLGWDGEQGPFLQVNENELVVNFTDINRADYLKNILDKDIGFDMSLVRNLQINELTDRMDCLRKCVRTIDHKKVWKTKLWLIHALPINDWVQAQSIKCLPKQYFPTSLGFNKRNNDSLIGKGYFYVFARTDDDYKTLDESFSTMSKRAYAKCKKLWLCQVTVDRLAYLEIDAKNEKVGEWIPG